MARFGQGLIQALTNPAYADKLNMAGMMAGSMPGRLRAEEEERNKKMREAQIAAMQATAMGATEEAARKRAMAQQVMAGQVASAQDPGVAAAAQAGAMRAGVKPTDVVAATSLAQQREKALADKANQDANAAFRDQISSMLSSKGQEGFANLVNRVPDFNALPAEVQKRILSAAGIEDTVAQQEALSPEGKRAMDMGFIPGTPEFQENVAKQIKVFQAGAPAEAFNAVNAAVKSTVDLGKTQKINDAVTAISSRGLAGSEALQENTIIDLFGSSLRAEAAVRRFGSSASLPRRVTDSVLQWATGEKTNLTNEDREAIIYAAVKMQEESLNTAVNNSSQALRIDEELVPNVRAVYDFPSYTKEWVNKYETKYRETKQKPSSDPGPSVVTSNEDYDALPSGTTYYYNGQKFIKGS